MWVDVSNPLVARDVSTLFGVNLLEERSASFDALLRSTVELSHSGSEAEAPWQVRSKHNHGVKVPQPDLAVEVVVCSGEALEQELVQLINL